MELRSLKGFKAAIHVHDAAAAPHFYGPRSVPHTELVRLFKEKFITSLKYSEWKASVIFLHKLDINCSLCGDYIL